MDNRTPLEVALELLDSFVRDAEATADYLTIPEYRRRVKEARAFLKDWLPDEEHA